MAIRFHFDGNQLKDFPPIEGLKSLTEWGCPRRFTTNRRMGRGSCHIDAKPQKGTFIQRTIELLYLVSNPILGNLEQLCFRYILYIHTFNLPRDPGVLSNIVLIADLVTLEIVRHHFRYKEYA